MAAPKPSPHKPRRKGKKTDVGPDKPARFPSETLVHAPSFALAAFLWPARTASSQWEVLIPILMVVGLFRWAAGFWGYSGFNRPPMYGDYEAQRHWMEITTQLPVSQWYFHDLQWWGLDYPPLTAYHSWALGKIGALLNPEWFALYTSRGLEDPNLKVFMRGTVFVSEYLIYIPAAVVCIRRYSRLNGVDTWTSSLALVGFLMQPATILIDHVHFQYNTVMLGLVLATMSSMLAERYKMAAVFFVGALMFKQMALYYAFTVFAYLLGRCLWPKISITRFLGIALATVIAYAVTVLPLFLGTLYDSYRGIAALEGPLPLFPWLGQYLDQDAFYHPLIQVVLQVVHRVFPFARGLFEDKVANFWCALNVVMKLRNYSPELLQKAALGATLLSILPPNIIVFLRPQKTIIPYAFAATAWGFFLFSWQVHEKSVLLPLMPMTLLLAGKQGMHRDVRVWVGFANILGAWTMFPLLRRVDLRVPYTVLTLLWAYLLGLPPTSWSVYFPKNVSWTQGLTGLVHCLFYIAMVGWHFVDAFVPPPLDKPDLWVVANVGLGVAGFGLCYLWCLWKLVHQSYILPSKTKGKKKSL